MKLLDALLALLLPALVLLHLVVAPYTKVEESFNIQAAHDVLAYGTPTGRGAGLRLQQRYDHFVFPGAVPRTFLGAVLLAGIGRPVLQLANAAGGAFALDGPAAQTTVRGVLGLANAGALVALGRALGRACGASAGRWYLVLQACQFHVVFYASRTLPNMFAFFLTTTAFAFLLAPPGGGGGRTGGRIRVALCLLTLAGVVFRAEVALLLAAVAAYLVAAPLAAAERIVRTVAVAAAVALALSVPVDSYFWQTVPPRPCWPELHGVLFNVVRGQASAWGTSPWHYYLSSALPRLLLDPLAPLLGLPLALRRPATRGPAALLVAPSLLFVAVYSLQPHKEARFVLYVVPPLTAAAALGADQLTKSVFPPRGRAAAGRAAALAWYALVLSVPLALAASTAMLLVSALNYPGGEALAVLGRLAAADAAAAAAAAPSTPFVVTAHADVLACMTGVTLFGSAMGGSSGGGYLQAPRLVVDKTEDPDVLADPAFWAQFDYLLVEDKRVVPAAAWDTVAVVEGYAGVEVLRPGQASADEEGESSKVAGHGATVARLRRAVRSRTGGWWVGPRMVPRITVLRRRKDKGVAAHGPKTTVV